MKSPIDVIRRVSRARRCRRRGSVLILVLAVSSIVGVIGLSSLTVVRIQHRDVATRANATQAAVLADSGLRLIHARLSLAGDWRRQHTHDVWSPDETLADGSALRYKLSDTRDTDLADDAQDTARLTVRVAHGNAVRLSSVVLGGTETLGPELVANGGGEEGSTGFGKTGLAGSINSQTDSPYAGNRYVQFTGRFLMLDALKYDLADDALVSGTTYRVTAAVRMARNAENVRLGLFQSRGLAMRFTEDVAPAQTSWTRVSFDLVPDFGFDPSLVYAYALPESSNQGIHLDEWSVREVRQTALPVVRGSYRRELDG